MADDESEKQQNKDDAQARRIRIREAVPWWEMSSRNRRYLYARSFLCNVVLFGLAYFGAFAIRFDGFQMSKAVLSMFWNTVGAMVAIKLAVHWLSRSYRNIGYFATMRELRSIVVAAIVSFAVAVVVFAVGRRCEWFGVSVPLSVLVADFGLTIAFRGGWRLLRRFYVETLKPTFDESTGEGPEPALLVCANELGARVADSINKQAHLGYRVVGFITRHEYKVRLRVGTLPVVAQIDNIPYAAKAANVRTVLFIAGSLPGSDFRRIFELCDKNGLKLQVVPQVEFLPDTKIPIREISVEDLLKRDPIKLDDAKIRELVAGRRVMVTGAGGSIGSEICRQLMRFEPKQLFLLGRGENRIFFLERELRGLKKSTVLTPIIASVSNAERMDRVFDASRPEIVFHAAAHKHVPLMEANIPEAIRNNIYGTKVVADLADKYGAEKFVMVSTDKAVNPSSVMGCSKQMAERYVNALAARSKTKFVVTRFGNVLGSNGSVVPIFTEQIRRGGPITITDLRMTRYFMTIPEASQLVLEAAAMGNGGEIFVLDMGEPVKIVEMAKDMIRLAGLPEGAIEIKETGLRPGEKLYEELYFESEKRIKTTQEKLFAAEHRQFDLNVVQAQLDELLSMTNGPQDPIRDKLREFVPEYKPTILPANDVAKTQVERKAV